MNFNAQQTETCEVPIIVKGKLLLIDLFTLSINYIIFTILFLQFYLYNFPFTIFLTFFVIFYYLQIFFFCNNLLLVDA